MEETKPYPKTKAKKHKALRNKRILDRGICENCGGYDFLETHELLRGSYRQLSIKYKLQKKLCNTCHSEVTTHRNKEWEREAQRMFIRMYPDLDFLDVFGINFL